MKNISKAATVASAPTSQQRRLESIAMALAGGVPLRIGNLIRQQIYRQIFASLGKNVTILPHVDFVGASQIDIGNATTLEQYVRLNCSGRNSKIRIGHHVLIGRGVDLKCEKHDSLIEIGDHSSIGSFSCLAGVGFVKIGNHCLIAPYVGIFSSNHNFADPLRLIREQGVTRKGIVIEDDCWIGSNAQILDGVTIGRGSVIGAGAVVSKSIPPYSVAVGVPAKVIAHRKAPTAVQLTSERGEVVGVSLREELSS